MRSFFCLTRCCFSLSRRLISVINASSRAGSCSTAASSHRTSHRSFVSRSIRRLSHRQTKTHRCTDSLACSCRVGVQSSNHQPSRFNSLQLGFLPGLSTMDTGFTVWRTYRRSGVLKTATGKSQFFPDSAPTLSLQWPPSSTLQCTVNTVVNGSKENARRPSIVYARRASIV